MSEAQKARVQVGLESFEERNEVDCLDFNAEVEVKQVDSL